MKESDPASTRTQLEGQVGKNARGFPIVRFVDSYGVTYNVTASSVIGDYEDAYQRPGTSAVWLGVDNVEAIVMAHEAAKYGVQTKETTGWVPYPIPDGVMLKSSLHLNREQVAALVTRLQQWLADGSFSVEDQTPGG